MSAFVNVCINFYALFVIIGYSDFDYGLLMHIVFEVIFMFYCFLLLWAVLDLELYDNFLQTKCIRSVYFASGTRSAVNRYEAGEVSAFQLASLRSSV